MDYDQTSSNSNFKLVESTNKIFYFTRLSLQKENIIAIYSFITRLKDNLLKQLIEQIKYVIKNLFFKNSSLSDNEKIMLIFSVMITHYYSRFSYNIPSSFEDFNTNDIINILSIKEVYPYKQDDFHVFSYTFFYEIKKEIEKLDYQSLRSKNFNGTFVMNKPNSDTINSQSFLILIKNYIQTHIQKMETYAKVSLKPLILTKERIVDMIVPRNKDMNNEKNVISSINSRFSSSENEYDKYERNDSNPYFSNKKYESKRVIGELTREETNEKEQDFSNELAFKFDSLVDVILSNSKQNLHNIRNFLCYILEISSDVIRLFPEYDHIPDNIKLRIITGAKDIYLLAFEVFFTSYDLYQIDLDSLVSLFKYRVGCKLNDNIELAVKAFFKMMKELIWFYNGKLQMEEVLSEVLRVLEEEWEEEINNKGKELSYFCKT